ncbi:MAG: hypothetical protein QW632_02055 [Ignisphaera sp.]
MLKRKLLDVLMVTSFILAIAVPLSMEFSYYMREIPFGIPLQDGYTNTMIIFSPFKCTLEVSVTCVTGRVNVTVIQGSRIQHDVLACNATRRFDVDSGVVALVFRVNVEESQPSLWGENAWMTVRRVIR